MGREEQAKGGLKLRSGIKQEGVDLGLGAGSALCMFIGVRAGPTLCSLKMPMGYGDNPFGNGLSLSASLRKLLCSNSINVLFTILNYP